MVLNDAYNVVMVREPEVAGEIVTFKEMIDDGCRVALVVGRADENASLSSPTSCSANASVPATRC